MQLKGFFWTDCAVAQCVMVTSAGRTLPLFMLMQMHCKHGRLASLVMMHLHNDL